MSAYSVQAFRDYAVTYWPNNRRAPIVSRERCGLVCVVVEAENAVDAIRQGVEEIEARGYDTGVVSVFHAEAV
jgi:hypothetical protein